MPHNNSQDQAAHAKPFPTLWVMIAIGPLAIDMYLPPLPTMADDFGVSVSEVSRSVPFYFIGLVLGQLFYGSFSDRVGRVLSMHIGMTVFVVASIICATTTSEAGAVCCPYVAGIGGVCYGGGNSCRHS